jgi:catechol 2,3-dioxygenase-like lactoylglutathione lyase family enzyme
MGKHGVRFGHVALRTANAERNVRWYDEAFGATRVFYAPREGERQELMFLEFHKGQYIEIFTNGKPRADQPADAIGYQHFCLIVHDIDARLEHLAAMNVYPQRPAREGRWHTASRFSPIPTTTSSS